MTRSMHQELYCATCSVLCKSAEQLAEHVEGQSHRRKTRDLVYRLILEVITAPPWTLRTALDEGLVQPAHKKVTMLAHHYQQGAWGRSREQIDSVDERILHFVGPPTEQQVSEAVSNAVANIVALYALPRHQVLRAARGFPQSLFLDQMIWMFASNARLWDFPRDRICQ